jgi:acyl-CoA thioesterase I
MFHIWKRETGRGKQAAPRRRFRSPGFRAWHQTPWFGILFLLLLAGCETEQRSGTTAAEPATAAPAAVAEHGEGVVLFVGTSLTAGYGLGEDQAYPALIQEKIDAAGLPYRVINAGVSGETSAGARRRLDWLLRQPFDVLVLETGANDMLRGQNPDSTRANIEAIVEQVRAARPDTRIVLAGMLAMPNLGREFGQRFERIYPEVAREQDLELVPFLLQDVAAQPELNLPDGIHPNEAGQRRLAETVWEVLEPVLREEAVAAR